MRRALVVALSLGFLAGTTTSVAHAQATRTWVSGVGDDLGTCARTAPCKTFAGALSKTAAGGEISVLDPGGYGVVTINKSITIDGSGTLAGILSALVNGVIVNAGVNDVVILRNLEIHGAGSGLDGVRFLNGKQLIIENTRIAGFTRNGVEVLVMSTGRGNLVIRNSTISTTTASGPGLGNGIRTSFGNTFVSQSLITMNEGVGLLAENGGVINADSNVLTYNGIAVEAGNGGADQSAATVRLSNNDVYNNFTGFGCGGGVLASAGNNRKGSNTGGSASACSPTAIITVQ